MIASQGNRSQRHWIWLCVWGLLITGCGGSGAAVVDLSEVAFTKPQGPLVKLPSATLADYDQALMILAAPDSTPEQRTQVYTFIHEVYLTIWNDVRADIDARKPGDAGTPVESLAKDGLPFFLEAYRARALAWVEDGRVEDVRSRVLGLDAEGADQPLREQHAQVWANSQSNAEKYEALHKLLGQVSKARDDGLISLDFLSDVRFSTAVFYGLLGRSTDDVDALIAKTDNNVNEAYRLIDNIGYIYERILLRPKDAAAAYRSIRNHTPQSRRGYEAQYEVFEAHLERRRLESLTMGTAVAFDRSPQGVALFKTMSADLALLAETSLSREQWEEFTSTTAGPGAAMGGAPGVDGVDRKVEKLLFDVIAHLQAALDGHSDATLTEVLDTFYVGFLTLFKVSPLSYGLHVQYGQSLAKRKRFAEAFEQFKAAYEMNKIGEYKEDVLRGMLVTGYEASLSVPLPARPVANDQGIPPEHKAFIVAAERFIDNYAETYPEEAGMARYQVSLRHYLYGKFAIADTELSSFVLNNSELKIAPEAAALWLDLHARWQLIGEKDADLLADKVFRVRQKQALKDHPIVQRQVAMSQKSPPNVDDAVFTQAPKPSWYLFASDVPKEE